MKTLSYKERLKIPILGSRGTKFYTPSSLLVAEGYTRIVIGKRGPYIEFEYNQLKEESIYIPDIELWRVNSLVAYYIEYRTKDISSIKIYYQKKKVDYADYKVGFCYISPFEIHTEENSVLIEPISRKGGLNELPY